MKNKPLLLIGGVVLIAVAIILSTFVVAPVSAGKTQATDFDNDSTNDSTYSVVSTLVDENGNTVTDLPYSFTYEGVDVSSLYIKVSWDVQGTDMNQDTFSVSGYLAMQQGIFSTDGTESLWTNLETTPIDLGAEGRNSLGQGLVDDTYSLLLIDPELPYSADNTGEGEYRVRAYTSLTFSCYDNYGHLFSEEFESEAIMSFGWFEDTGEWNVIADTDVSTTIDDTDPEYDPEDGREIDPERETDPETGDDTYAFDATGGSINPIENPAVATLLVGFLMVVVQFYTNKR